MIEIFAPRLLVRLFVIAVYVAAVRNGLFLAPFIAEAVMLWCSIKYVEGSWGCMDCGATGRGHRSVHRCSKGSHR